ncbi:hypothetical protein OTU49_012218 [Cherax quadricarinatus]|uniref:Uncharacterized protein n=1 Tax=Cherax quadricarinatus TaxID=27406 RepID=A0AAW0VZR9_CHEQU
MGYTEVDNLNIMLPGVWTKASFVYDRQKMMNAVLLPGDRIKSSPYGYIKHDNVNIPTFARIYSDGLLEVELENMACPIVHLHEAETTDQDYARSVKRWKQREF